MLEDVKTKDLSLIKILSASFKIYTMNIKAIAVFTTLVYIPILLLQRFVIVESANSLFAFLGIEEGDDLSSILTYLENVPIELVPNIMHTAFIIGVAYVIMAVVFSPLIESGSTHLMIESIEDRQSSANNMMNTAISNIFKTFITMLLSLACIAIGISLFVLPGIYLAVCFAFATPAVIMTGKWGFGALKESFKVVSGRWFRALALILLSGLLAVMLTMFIQGVSLIILPQNMIVEFIVSLFTGIFLTYFVMVECLWFINKYFVYSKNDKMENRL